MRRRRSQCACPARALGSSTVHQSIGTAPAGRGQSCRSSGSMPSDDVQHVGEVGHGARRSLRRSPSSTTSGMNAAAALEAVGAAQRHQARRRSPARRGSRRSAIPSRLRRSFPPPQRPNRRSTRARDFDGRCTFHTCPHASLDQWPNVAYSSSAVLPMITAPASRSLATWNASRAGRKFCEREAAVRRRHVERVVVVLDRDRDAEQRAASRPPARAAIGGLWPASWRRRRRSRRRGIRTGPCRRRRSGPGRPA